MARIEPTFCIVAIDKLILDGLAPPDSAVVFEVLGCACCKARDSFVSLLKRIAVDGTFDYVFVEPTSEGIYILSFIPNNSLLLLSPSIAYCAMLFR